MSKDFDIEKFIKVMKLSTSSFDGEALSSLRLANKMLTASNLTWDNVISVKIDKPVRPDVVKGRDSNDNSKDSVSWLIKFLDNSAPGGSASVIIHRLKIGKAITPAMSMFISNCVIAVGSPLDKIMWNSCSYNRFRKL